MLLTVGDLLEEVLVQLPGEPPRRQTTPVRSARVRGGSAANVAAITSERGGASRFVGRVGADAVGRTLADDLVRRGVDTRIEHSGGTGGSTERSTPATKTASMPLMTPLSTP